MKPVAIVRHSPHTGAGYFATFLEAHQIAWRLIAIDRGDRLPDDLDAFSGMALMGGPMSVNDPLPWIDPLCGLIREAVADGRPLIGHCLGGQLISKALGGTVGRSPQREIGWHAVQRVDAPGDAGHAAIARRWLGELPSPLTVFQWHNETFTIPDGATHLLRSAGCANQMYVLGPHLGMQFHPEMTAAMISDWCAAWGEEMNARTALPPSIQRPQDMLADLPARLADMRRLTDRLYRVWISGLPR